MERAAAVLSAMAAGMLIQILMGHPDFEFGLYAQILFGLQLPDYLLFALLALVVHALVNQKYLGHLVIVIAYVFMAFAPALGVREQPARLRLRSWLDVLGHARLRTVHRAVGVVQVQLGRMGAVAALRRRCSGSRERKRISARGWRWRAAASRFQSQCSPLLPGPSIEERYASHGAYVNAVARAASDLHRQRLLLGEDVDRIVQAAAETTVGK